MSEEDLAQLENLTRLDPSSTYVLTLRDRVPMPIIEQMGAVWKTQTRAQLIVIDGGATLAEMTDEFLASLGLMRMQPVCAFCGAPILSGTAHGLGVCLAGGL
jgi:hypothetical protein